MCICRICLGMVRILHRLPHVIGPPIILIWIPSDLVLSVVIYFLHLTHCHHFAYTDNRSDEEMFLFVQPLNLCRLYMCTTTWMFPPHMFKRLKGVTQGLFFPEPKQNEEKRGFHGSTKCKWSHTGLWFSFHAFQFVSVSFALFVFRSANRLQRGLLH